MTAPDPVEKTRVARDIPCGTAVDACIREMVARGDTVAVAFSGGADSTFALLWLLARYPAKKVVALHYHHGVRGEAADGDLAHCVATASALGIRILHERRAPDGARDEQSLRRDRLAFLDRACAEVGATALVQGHHADDVAETLLMRLGRGYGAGGLAAPRPVSATPGGIRILRPLLGIRKEEILRRLQAGDIAWRHDETNDSAEFATRNRIRGVVIPTWTKALPGDAVAGACISRARLQEDDEALELWAERVLKSIGANRAEGESDWGALDMPPPAAVTRRVLRKLLSRHAPGFSPEAAAFDDWLTAILEGTTHHLSLGAHGIARFDGRTLKFPRPTGFPTTRTEALLPLPGAVYWPDGASLSADYTPEGAASETRTFLMSPVGPAVLHCAPRAPGERYTPCGAPGSQKLQDAMVNRKIPAAERDRIPVVRNDAQILWAPGLLPEEKYRAPAGENRPLRLTWTPPGAV